MSQNATRQSDAQVHRGSSQIRVSGEWSKDGGGGNRRCLLGRSERDAAHNNRCVSGCVNDGLVVMLQCKRRGRTLAGFDCCMAVRWIASGILRFFFYPAIQGTIRVISMKFFGKSGVSDFNVGKPSTFTGNLTPAAESSQIWHTRQPSIRKAALRHEKREAGVTSISTLVYGLYCLARLDLAASIKDAHRGEEELQHGPANRQVQVRPTDRQGDC